MRYNYEMPNIIINIKHLPAIVIDSTYYVQQMIKSTVTAQGHHLRLNNTIYKHLRSPHISIKCFFSSKFQPAKKGTSGREIAILT